MNKPLSIIDTSTLIPGPFATYLLQKHLSSTVVKIEDVRVSDKLSEVKPTKNGVSLFYQAANDKKRILKVDFASGNTGKLNALLKTADVFVTSFKPSRALKVGLSPKDVSALNPSITYCSISGYPDKHPLAGFAAHDINILALSGFLSWQTAIEGRPSLPPIQLADLFTSYHVALRICAHRMLGRRDVLHLSMLEATIEALQIYHHPQKMLKRPIDDELSYQHHLPCYHIYKVRDGYVAVGAVETSFWIDLCHLLGRNDLITKQFDGEVIKELAIEFAKRTKAFFFSYNVCVTPVLTVAEAAKLKLA